MRYSLRTGRGPLKHTHIPATAALALMVVSVAFGLTVRPHASATTIQYQTDSSIFPNPERGFSQADGDPAQVRAKNMSLMHVYFRLDPYKSSALPSSYLATVSNTFDQARAAGIKVIPRFTYNFPSSWPIDPVADADAPVSRVLSHLDQLAPILQANSDVIAYMEGGFVGAWGEWHSSTNDLTSTVNETAILNKILSILPSNRDVALRYERDKKAIFGRTTPISSTEAFSGTNFARVGHINDCFVSSLDDTGTYDAAGSPTLQEQKDYLHSDNQYVPQGGETCNSGSSAQTYIQCPAAMSDLAYQHWSQINSDYEPGVLALWRSQGCYDTIAQKLGYRFRLTGSSLPDQVKPGGAFTATINLINDGYAAPYNSRGLELVLRQHQSGAEYVLPLSSDPRRWAPGAAQTLSVSAGLPAAMPTGSYDVFINLPDPAPRLYGLPAYSIRLANVGVWEASTGYNSLLSPLTVSTTAAGAAYSGTTFFQSKSGQLLPSPATNKADFNADGRVNVFDLSQLLSAWGAANPALDINGDGQVNIFDLSALLSSWTG